MYHLDGDVVFGRVFVRGVAFAARSGHDLNIAAHLAADITWARLESLGEVLNLF
ncbi:MAG: hypothetical protein ND866_26235 [Pyrinomonadaceae bacterium]|nr:hypothetical protein [Pyrinomonadaceae bacterium]